MSDVKDLFAKLNKSLGTNQDEVMEMLENINARLERLELGAKSAVVAPKANGKASDSRSSGNGSGCAYIKIAGADKGNACNKKCRPNDDYCIDHPGGMTRAQAKKLEESGGSTSAASKTETLKMDAFEDDESYEVISSPPILKGVLITAAKPHRAFVRVGEDGVFSPLDDEVTVNALKKFKVLVAKKEEAIKFADEFNQTLDFDDAPPAKKITVVKKATPVVIKPAAKRPVKEEEDEDDDEDEKPAPKAASKPAMNIIAKIPPKTIVPVSKKPAAPAKKASEDEDEDEDDKPAPRKPLIKAVVKKPVKDDEDEDDEDRKTASKKTAPKKKEDDSKTEEEEDEASKKGETTATDAAHKAVSKIPEEKNEDLADTKVDRNSSRVVPKLKAKSPSKKVPSDDEQEPEDE
jgi:hypothetical protein